MKSQKKSYEVQFFDALAVGGHYEPLTEDFYIKIFAFLESFGVFPSGKIVECGCGTGAFGRRFLSRFAGIETIVGVDLSSKMIAICAEEKNSRYQPITGDLENPNLFPLQHFQAALCPYILHHFPDIRVVVKNISQWLESQGTIVLIEPNGDSPINRISKFGRRVCEVLFGLEWVMQKGLATPNETDHTIDTYRTVLTENGFKIVGFKTFTVKREFLSLRSMDSLIGATKQLLIILVDKIMAGTRYAGATTFVIAQKSVSSRPSI